MFGERSIGGTLAEQADGGFVQIRLVLLKTDHHIPTDLLSHIEHLRAGMLCLADRLFFSYKLWQKAAKTGADLLWRVKQDMRLEMAQRLPDGSYLSHVYASASDRRNRRNAIAVRVIEYRLKGVKGSEPLYRLVTTILDCTQAPADELAALYHERWEIEIALDELKTHLRGPQIVLRSKTPELVKQEFYGPADAPLRHP